MDCSHSGSSVHGIFQSKVWNELPFPSPSELPNPGIKPRSPAMQMIVYHWATREAPFKCIIDLKLKLLFHFYCMKIKTHFHFRYFSIYPGVILIFLKNVLKCIFLWLDSIFPFSAEQYFIVYICHNSFIHSPTETPLGCFQILDIRNEVTINLLYAGYHVVIHFHLL